MIIKLASVFTTALVLATCKADADKGFLDDGFNRTYTRTSLSHECDVPSDCSYQCSAGYQVTVNGNILDAKSTARTDCACYEFHGAIQGSDRDSAVGDYPLVFVINRTNETAESLAVVTKLSDFTCTATFEVLSSVGRLAPAVGLLLAFIFVSLVLL